MKGLEKYDFKSSFKTWVFRVATNVVIDYGRKERRHIKYSVQDYDLSPGYHIEQGNSIEKMIIEKDEITALKKALKRLPVKLKTIVILKEFNELTFVEISEILKIPVSTVKSRLYTALEKLRVEIDKYFQGGMNVEN